MISGEKKDNDLLEDTDIVKVVSKHEYETLTYSVSLKKYSASYLDVYPNPSHKYIYVETIQEGNLSLITNHGERILQLTHGKNYIETIPKGIYHVVLKKDGLIQSSTSFYKME